MSQTMRLRGILLLLLVLALTGPAAVQTRGLALVGFVLTASVVLVAAFQAVRHGRLRRAR